MKAIETISDITDRVMSVIAFMGLLGFTVMMTIQVFQRNFTPAHAWVFADAMCRYFFIWATFTGISMVSKRRKQITITLLPDMLKGIPLRILQAINYAIFLFFIVFVIYWGVIACINNLSQNLDSVPFPAAVVYAAIPVGFTALLIQEVNNLLHDLQSWKKGGNT